MTLRTSISIEECKKRLVAAVDPVRIAFSMSGYAGSKPILGKIHDTGFRLQKRRSYRNSFAPYFFGRFVAASGGTLIEGKFRMHLFVKVFMICWFSFLGVSIVTMIGAFATGQMAGQSHPVLGLVIPVGMAIFGVALIKFGQWLGRGEKQDILVLLKSTLEAEDAV